jgi:CxxC motif-containing protein (DUF1111 family)
MRARRARVAVAVTIASILTGCGGGSEGSSSDPPPPPPPLVDERLAGGDLTVFLESSDAFENPAPNLTAADEQRHRVGDTAFDDVFVTAPSPVNSGLGPVFNNTSCSGCHLNNGRGRPPDPGQQPQTLLLRTSIGNDTITGPFAAQGYGTQLQGRAVFGADPEATFDLSYDVSTVSLTDGTAVELRTPVYTIASGYATLPAGMVLSARAAPPVFGRGLLEAVPAESILALADESDGNGDGISGRPNFVTDAVSGEVLLGRFGLKANTARLIAQNAEAYQQDIGITNELLPTESAFAQTQDDGILDDPELEAGKLDAVTFYIRSLGVPARRNADDAQVLAGQALFQSAQCAACHVPQLETGDFSEEPMLAHQIIFPYTDLLLHDMGEGLADGRDDFIASGSEWRTAPLWGLGLTPVVSGETLLLHDGRARNVLEAILWHGGEAQSARDAVADMSTANREALLAFLGSL